VQDILTPGRISRQWDNDDKYVACGDCFRGETDDGETCGTCRGNGEVAYRPVGVSVCRDAYDLRAYLAGRSPCLDGAVLVEVEGDECDYPDHDAECAGSPLLIIPTRIVSITPVNDGFLD
jgi:hypothetical protein